jgi:hypothetical protein
MQLCLLIKVIQRFLRSDRLPRSSELPRIPGQPQVLLSKILCSSDEVLDTFSLTLGECIGLLGATTRSHPNHGELHTPGADKAGRSSGSSCGRRAQAQLE